MLPLGDRPDHNLGRYECDWTKPFGGDK